VKSIR